MFHSSFSALISSAVMICSMSSTFGQAPGSSMYDNTRTGVSTSYASGNGLGTGSSSTSSNPNPNLGGISTLPISGLGTSNNQSSGLGSGVSTNQSSSFGTLSNLTTGSGTYNNPTSTSSLSTFRNSSTGTDQTLSTGTSSNLTTGSGLYTSLSSSPLSNTNASSQRNSSTGLFPTISPVNNVTNSVFTIGNMSSPTSSLNMSYNSGIIPSVNLSSSFNTTLGNSVKPDYNKSMGSRFSDYTSSFGKKTKPPGRYDDRYNSTPHNPTGDTRQCQEYTEANTTRATCNSDGRTQIVCSEGCTGGIIAQNCRMNSTSPNSTQTCDVGWSKSSAYEYVCQTLNASYTCNGPSSGSATCNSCLSARPKGLSGKHNPLASLGSWNRPNTSSSWNTSSNGTTSSYTGNGLSGSSLSGVTTYPTTGLGSSSSFYSGGSRGSGSGAGSASFGSTSPTTNLSTTYTSGSSGGSRSGSTSSLPSTSLPLSGGGSGYRTPGYTGSSYGGYGSTSNRTITSSDYYPTTNLTSGSGSLSQTSSLDQNSTESELASKQGAGTSAAYRVPPTMDLVYAIIIGSLTLQAFARNAFI